MVEGTCLENKRAGNGTEGSNPSLSARSMKLRKVGAFSMFKQILHSPSLPCVTRASDGTMTHFFISPKLHST